MIMYRKIKQLIIVFAFGFGMTFMPETMLAGTSGAIEQVAQTNEITVKGNVVDVNNEPIIGLLSCRRAQTMPQ
jgi:hypothetical protein